MRVLKFLSLMAMLGCTIGQSGSATPECALRCWENTKYVTKCSEDQQCLCSDVNYQNSVFQCIYSQCDTVHFGSALHHAIAQCLGTDNEVFFAIPPIPDRDALRRREDEYAAGAKLFGSGSAAGYPTESAAFPVQSANYPTDSVGGPYSPSPTASVPFPYFSLTSVTSPAAKSATTTEATRNTVPASTTAPSPSPQLYTGNASTSRATVSLTVVLTVAAVYLVL
ncbi:uncharacterized protein L3040_005974 [Drepanopeziza brunnea f. sp. 'multigermtubi']|uniref:uncharacterized protein n=1 Tax=Drepanopeziza brunnea f. sp. 'multigermtubi' TaxID=698441 RepID=UPI002382DAA9|nr:hypothetical protein L3040_005974 [Drepanopeziza brunnea f. sp. 'multigermtubi']WBR35413.1 effector protein CFEM9 [Drepanopeziza brunnea]